MEGFLHEVIGRELRRRHGVGMMEGKLKPVHVANALMRAEHGTVGRMSDLKMLMTATASKESSETRLAAAQQMLDASRDRWGRLGEERDLRRSTLVTKVLPLLRTILATDAAAFGTSPDQSSFSSPTALTVTGDPSDDHAGEFVHRLWSGTGATGERLHLLDLLRDTSAPGRDLATVDDLTAVLAPLADDVRERKPIEWRFEDLAGNGSSAIAEVLRSAAADLGTYERHARPNPIASLQRIVTLASISVFFHASTRAAEWAQYPRRILLLDASGTRLSPVAAASELLVTRLMEDGRGYMADVLSDLLTETRSGWAEEPSDALAELARNKAAKKGGSMSMKVLAEVIGEISDAGGSMADELPRQLVERVDGASGRSLDGFLRLFGVRCGLLYPQQKNPNKRLVPADRTLEVLAVSTFDAAGRQLEYRDFLDALHDRWSIVVGGRPEDGALLAAAGAEVDSASLAENSERLLSRLEALGLARRLADSVAVVGMMDDQQHV
ncbi:hypothetical protein [Sphingomonas bacterium]|uniref:hypothetical protein n=1 Tax=Sphingomonas bacterium TaxID=1895847 RepID=UPI00157574C6|nr:hypothetical protein [Sphingomonas bacterium]